MQYYGEVGVPNNPPKIQKSKILIKYLLRKKNLTKLLVKTKWRIFNDKHSVVNGLIINFYDRLLNKSNFLY